MKIKNKNLVYFALIFALILAFCVALLLSVFVGEKVAFAAEDTPLNLFQLCSAARGDSVDGIISSNTVTPSVSNDFIFIPFSSYLGSTTITIPLDYTAMYTHGYLIIFDAYATSPFTLSCPWGSVNSFDITTSLTRFYYFKGRGANFDYITLSASNPRADLYLKNFMVIDYYFTPLVVPSSNAFFSISNFLALFPDTYYPSGSSLVRSSYSSGYSAGVTDGYESGYSSGYSNGFSSAVDTIANFNYVVQSDMFVNLSDTSSIYSLIKGSYYTFSKITTINSTTAISEVGLNIGWADIFPGTAWNTLSLSNVAFSWRLGTASKSTNGLSYSTFNFVSSDPVFLPNNHLQISASDPNSSRSYIQIDLEEHSGTITVPCFLSSYSSSDSVPNLYPLYQLTPLTFTMDSNLANAFSDGYNNGYRVATSTVIDTSASWSAGYNAGVSSAQNTTFDSLMSAVIDVPIRTIGGLLDFNFLGINLLQFIYSLLTLGIIIAIIRLCLGKS